MLTILLDQAAIEEALTNYIGETTLGVDLSNKEVSIKLTAGRSDNGHRAEITIAPREVIDVPVGENDVPDLGAAPDEAVPDEPAIGSGPFD